MASKKIKTLVQIVYLDETGDSQHRMRWPAEQLAKQSSWRVINLSYDAKERHAFALNADLLVLYQCSDPSFFPIIKQRRERGLKTLVEYNDNFYDPPAASPVSAEWSSPLIWQVYEKYMDEADGVLVTGEGLKQLFSEQTDTEIHILENHLPEEPPKFKNVWSKPEGSINLGWAGSVGHMADLLALVPVFKEISKERENVHFHFMGNSSIPGLLNLPEERLHYTPWGTMEDYLKFWENVHIGVAPLINTPYNNCRSDVKAIEMSSRAVVPILCDATPYHRFLEETKPYTFWSFEELKELILKFVDDPALLKKEAKKCYYYVAKNRVGPKRKERFKLFDSMMPKELVEFEWGMSAGYHELSGTKTATNNQHILELRSKIKEGKIDEARQLAAAYVSENSLDVDACLELARLKTKLKEEDALEFLIACKENFPKDLRFYLFEITLRDINSDEFLVSWKEMVDRLAISHQSVRDFYRDQVLNVYCTYLQQNIKLLAFAETLLELYPLSVMLNGALGEIFEKLGDYEKARKCFDYILVSLKNYKENERFLKSRDEDYLKTWCEALVVREKQSF